MIWRIITAALLLLSGVEAAAAQDALGWNSPRALELVARARARRELPRGDSTLRNYQAKANGYVYFYLDRRENEERTLVKVDQVALDLFWKRPNLTKQRIVGMRDVSRLPNRMYYHLDHLTVVQNGFGDVIKIGDGDEVRDVPHPAAPGADTIYDYRLADSVTLQMGGQNPEVRVYQIQVKPKRTNHSALIGSMYVDRGSADIVRMTFTFTPASYVDKRLDYINISLDNGLFGGSYWLPNEQSVEIRRQIPELDFAAGAVIKGRMRIADYAFNQPIPDSIFYGHPVSIVSEEQRKQYAFPEDIYAGVTEEGLAPPPQMQDLRAMAAQLVHENHLSGLPPLRFYIPNASSVLRHDKAEGWYGGLGLTYAPTVSFRADGLAGFAFGAKRPEFTLRLSTNQTDSRFSVTGYYNQTRDIGSVQGMPGALNTLTSAFGGRDYTDNYFVRGASLEAAGNGRWQPRFGLRVERQVAAYADTLYRSQTGVENGRAIEAGFGFTRPMPNRALVGWSADLSASLINMKYDQNPFDFAETFLRFNGRADFFASSENKRTTLSASLTAGANSIHNTPGQYDFLVGGRETLPGFRYREFDIQKFAIVNSTLSRTIIGPWIRARVLGSFGYLGPDYNRKFVNCGDCYYTDFTRTRASLRGSGGAGVGLLWDVIHVDVVRGREWQALFSVRKDFWDML